MLCFSSWCKDQAQEMGSGKRHMKLSKSWAGWSLLKSGAWGRRWWARQQSLHRCAVYHSGARYHRPARLWEYNMEGVQSVSPADQSLVQETNIQASMYKAHHGSDSGKLSQSPLIHFYACMCMCVCVCVRTRACTRKWQHIHKHKHILLWSWDHSKKQCID